MGVNFSAVRRYSPALRSAILRACDDPGILRHLHSFILTMLHTISRQRATFIFIITLLCFIGLFSPVRGPRRGHLPRSGRGAEPAQYVKQAKELTPQDKLVQQDLTQTLETLDKIERIKSETAQLRQQVEQAPAKLRQAVESLNNLSDVPNDDATRKTLSYALPASAGVARHPDAGRSAECAK